jgi:hypothetical protein
MTGQWVYERVLDIIFHQRNTNKNNEISPHICLIIIKMFNNDKMK